MVTIFVHRNGQTEKVTSIDRLWLNPAAGAYLWVDLAAPSIPELLILSETFGFHPLSVEDARAALEYPKLEAYDGYLYAVLHGIDFGTSASGFSTHDVDFFIGGTYLVTVHDGHSSSILGLQAHIDRNHKIMAEGPVSLFHRLVDTMVDHYRPEVDKLEDRIDELEKAVFEDPSPDLIRQMLSVKREVSNLKRILTPQRDVITRLARRDFVDISTELAFRFRDVYDHIVRLVDDAALFHDRLTGILEAHLTNVSNRLNEVMKVLTVMTTIFMPLTLLSGLWGMNIPLPRMPGSEDTQFLDLSVLMVVVVLSMLWIFRRKRWI
ncbi:MAG: magnesium/cobalt transporter CorA [Acidobacteriaceae bacterium]|jgi:magnesium transporter|nr:magnesium/cobalt transporter CorA [Acidobacteriaceae bacterium]